MKRHTIAIFSALALFGAAGASAQTPVNADASIVIPTLLEITVDETTVTFDQPTLADYTTGHVFGDVTSVVVTRGNVAHDVTVAADAATMGFVASAGGADPLKPASDMQWSVGGGWSSLSTTAADVAAGLARGTNDPAASVTYRMLLNEATDEPGTYTLGFTYTVVAN